MRRNNDDEARAPKNEAVRPAGQPCENGLGAHSGISDQFIDLDDQRAAKAPRDEGGREEEESVPLVNERAAVAACQAQITVIRGEIVEELEEFEGKAWQETGEPGKPAAFSGSRFGKGRRTGGLARIDPGGARENDLAAQFLECADDAGNVNGFGPGAAGAEMIEEGDGIQDLGFGTWDSEERAARSTVR